MTSSTKTFYEFFAGGRMARAGLGEGWQCAFANDICGKKAAAYASNWGSQKSKGTASIFPSNPGVHMPLQPKMPQTPHQ